MLIDGARQDFRTSGHSANGVFDAPSIPETPVQGIHPFPAFSILPNPGLVAQAGISITFATR